MMGLCGVCAQDYTSAPRGSLRRHKRATGHCVCPKCSKVLASSEDVAQHDRIVHNWKCPQCSMKLVNKQDLVSHQRKLSHCYCGDCNRAFDTPTALKSHLETSEHSTEFRCCDCDRSFVNTHALDQHLRYKTHKRKTNAHKCRHCRQQYKTAGALAEHVREHQRPTKARCQKCSQEFKNTDALEQHMNSIVHHPLGDIRCIFGASCGKTFSSPSALLHHLESGACSSGMSRAALNEIVVAHDEDRVITRPGGILHPMLTEVNKRLESSSGSVSSSPSVSGVMIPTPSSDIVSSLALTPDSLTSRSLMSDWIAAVSQSSKNRCPFCAPTRRPFRTKLALEDHLRSAAHSKSIFFCPTSLMTQQSTKHPERKFRTASGLAQHIESGACSGGAAVFSKAVRYLETQFRSFGLNVGLATLTAT